MHALHKTGKTKTKISVNNLMLKNLLYKLLGIQAVYVTTSLALDINVSDPSDICFTSAPKGTIRTI